jgi:FG-GAP repeat
MLRYMVVVLIGILPWFPSLVFADSQSTTIPESFRPHLIHHIQKQASSNYVVQDLRDSSSGTSYQASNTSHKLALGFGVRGVDVRPAKDPSWHMGMKLSAIGYGNNLQSVASVASGAMTTNGNRVEYRHDQLTEWYLNGPLGLEQGFTLNRPPGGKHQAGGLVLALALSGDLKAVPNANGREIQFQTAQGKTALRFRDLYVFDATGKQLASRFISASNGYCIQVDDTSAVYPVNIDPLLFNETKLTASDAAGGDQFGTSVAISGDTIVVGALGGNSSTGAAYVFVRSGTTWTQQQKLTASDGAANDRFGISVAFSEDTAVVGAPSDDDAGSNSGSAYVFVRSSGIWSQQQKLTASDAASGDSFGYSVSISGDTVVVGAYEDDDGGFSSGSAYVFVRSSGIWSQQQKLTASDAAVAAQFGVSVAISGDTAVAGASLDNSQRGAAYVFVRSGTSWFQQKKLTASAKAAQFGLSVSISNDTAVVGAFSENSFRGAAYVFVRSGTSWFQQKKLTASDAASGDGFGHSVSISGDTAVVGARLDDNVGTSSGSAYVFVRSGTSWFQQKKLTASDEAELDFFGDSVAISGDTVVVGAPLDDDAGSNSGSAYVYASSGKFVFQGTMTGTMFCDDGIGTGVKQKFKDNVTITVDTLNLPVVTAFVQLEILDESFDMTGMALLKGKKSGLLQLFGDDGGDKEMALSGNIKIHKKTQEWTSLKGKFQFQDNDIPVCTLAGKFKAK